jgi:hypothetical protein
MGTRSITRVFSEDGAELVCMYGQFDGYPEGHGIALAEFLDSICVMPLDGSRPPEFKSKANGMGCLAAQLVARFKEHPGGFYLWPTGGALERGYTYEIRLMGNGTKMTCSGYGRSFEGAPKAFIEWAGAEETEED